MPRNAGVVVENNLTGGLITEATGLNFPENAVTATDNCVFDPIGGVRRRSGIDKEPGSVNFVTVSEENVSKEFVWENVGGNGNFTFLVQQIGAVLYFFNSDGSTALSDSFVSSFNLAPYVVDGNNVSNHVCGFTTGLGRLIVTHPFCDPFFISYDKNTNTFGSERILIQTRDFKGLEPRPTQRDPNTSPEQLYNRYNQGWITSRISEYRSKLGFYPSDFEVWWLYKGPDPAFPSQEVFLPPQIVNQIGVNTIDRGNSFAPNGSVILNEFYQDRSAATGIGPLAVVTSGTARPSTCAFHAGRAFYSGVNFGEWSSKVYFSQIVERSAQFGRCYQENDPASQYSPDLLPSDGGVVSIPEAGSVLQLWSIANSLLAICSNGIWEITGSSGIGFAATDYTVKKISSLTTITNLSFVNVNGAPFWWGQDGIYAAVSEGGGAISVQNISDKNIKTFFFNILENNRRFVKGVYNPKEQIIQWLYRTGVATTIKDQFTYNRILNFNLKSQAFYDWGVSSSTMRLKGIFATKGTGEVTVQEDVVNNSGTVITDNALDEITIPVEITTTNSSQFKYTVVNTNTTAWTFGEEDVGSKEDWIVGQPGAASAFESSFTTGYRLRGQAMTKFQENYIRFFNLGNGVFQFYPQWDYKGNPASGRFGSPQLVTFFDSLDGNAIQTRRKKVRGHGLALQLTIKSVDDNDFNIIGWSGFDSSNARL